MPIGRFIVDKGEKVSHRGFQYENLQEYSDH